MERMKIDGGTEVNLGSRVSSLIQGLQSLAATDAVSESVRKSVGAVVALKVPASFSTCQKSKANWCC